MNVFLVDNLLRASCVRIIVYVKVGRRRTERRTEMYIDQYNMGARVAVN